MASEVPNYPIFLRLEGLSCLVVGGRRAACDKVNGLIATNANLTVVAIDIDPQIEEIGEEYGLVIEKRPYRSGEAANYELVIAATGIAAIDHEVANDAKHAKVLVNVVDDRATSSFIMPAVFKKGDLTVAVSTNGNSPAFASFVRDEIADSIGNGADELLEVIGAVRAHLQELGESTEGRDWRGLITSTVAAYRSDGLAAARNEARKIATSWVRNPEELPSESAQ